jgi:hypothetical protein
MEGTLAKLSGKGKWQSRYFVLDSESLAYYPNSKKQKAKRKSVATIADLDNISKGEIEKDGNFQVLSMILILYWPM